MVAYIPSPHGAPHMWRVELIVVHCMAEFIDTEIEDWYGPEYLRHIGLSAHRYITPSGVVIQARKNREGAYHARGFNANSLGVEILVPGLHTYGSFLEAIKFQWHTQAQWVAAVQVVREWLKLWPRARLARHSDLSPGRKFDPGGGFPWGHFIQAVGGEFQV